MTWRTHALAAVASLWLLAPLPPGFTGGTGEAGVLALAAALGALLPDLDAAQSKAAHLSLGGVAPLALPALALHRAFGHRGLLHSALGLMVFGVLVCLPLALWWGRGPSLALGLGYASHLAADACTRTGVPLLYPRRRRYFLLPPRRRFVTGSPAEEALLPLLAAVDLLWLVHTLNAPR